MPQISVQEQLRRTLTFLYGLKDPRIRNYLAGYGFTADELKKGWGYLLKVAGGMMDETSIIDITVNKALMDLDQRENKWFPIVAAVLKNNFPDVYDRIFLNLVQQSGREVIISMTTFIERIEKLPTDDVTPGAKEAFDLLETRGFNEEERNSVHELLSTIQDLDVPADEMGKVDDSEEDLLELQRWYSEWSDIARVIIPRKDLRIRLGVSSPTPGDGTAEEELPIEESETEEMPED